jgi:hypothetical protein
MHVSEGINLGFRCIVLSDLWVGACTARFTGSHVYSSELGCSLVGNPYLGCFWPKEAKLCFFPNIGSASPFSLEWAITLGTFHTDWKYYHTKPDQFLPSRATFLIYQDISGRSLLTVRLHSQSFSARRTG